ncbi:MAG: YabP/YqfC family sporulation protein [Huintestinicola sp.]
MNDKNKQSGRDMDCTEINHTVTVEGRRKLVITGVTDTDKFNERSVLLYTCMGEMIIKGRDLHVSGLSVENGEMVIEGEISSVSYGDSDVRSPMSAFRRAMR